MKQLICKSKRGHVLVQGKESKKVFTSIFSSNPSLTRLPCFSMNLRVRASRCVPATRFYKGKKTLEGTYPLNHPDLFCAHSTKLPKSSQISPGAKSKNLTIQTGLWKFHQPNFPLPFQFVLRFGNGEKRMPLRETLICLICIFVLQHWLYIDQISQESPVNILYSENEGHVTDLSYSTAKEQIIAGTY